MADVSLSFVQNLYRDYYYLYPFKGLESMNGPYRVPFEAMFDQVAGGSTGSLLEIGCDSVDQMRFFLDRGLSCTAINPTLNEAEQRKGEVHFIEGFYGSQVVSGRYDFIVSRFNLEHVIFLDQFLSMVRSNLSPGGKVIVQVPNAESFLKQGVLNIFAHEHAQYFCKLSLINLISRHGFNIDVLPEVNEPSLICVFSDGLASYKPKEALRSQKDILDDFRKLIAEANGKVFLYGASLSLTALLYSDRGDEGILQKVRIIDDNISLHGKFMPQTDFEILKLSDISFGDDDVIVLSLARQYHDQVAARLRSRGCRAVIFVVDAEGIRKVS